MPCRRRGLLTWLKGAGLSAAAAAAAAVISAVIV